MKTNDTRDRHPARGARRLRGIGACVLIAVGIGSSSPALADEPADAGSAPIDEPSPRAEPSDRAPEGADAGVPGAAGPAEAPGVPADTGAVEAPGAPADAGAPGAAEAPGAPADAGAAEAPGAPADAGSPGAAGAPAAAPEAKGHDEPKKKASRSPFELALHGYGDLQFAFYNYGANQNRQGGSQSDRRLVFDTSRFVFELEGKMPFDLEFEAEVEFEHGGAGITQELDYEEFGEFEQEVEKGGRSCSRSST